MFPNPLIAGFYPDPSICRVDDAYYLACSTFEYLPGIPVFRSTDLSHWDADRPRGDRPEQVARRGRAHGGGVWAPTIRYHDGVFYVIVTDAMGGGMLIFTATTRPGRGATASPLTGSRHRPGPGVGRRRDGVRHLLRAAARRPRSGPAPGHPAGPDRPDDRQGARAAALAVVGHRAEVPGGAAPVRVDGTWYLMIAEGGTERGHGVSVARGPPPRARSTGTRPTRFSPPAARPARCRTPGTRT